MIELETASLTTIESQELALRESMIRQAQEVFWTVVAEQLQAIRDKRLYRDVAPDFDTYCKSVWGFSSSRASQRINGATTTKYIHSVTGVTLPSEAVARQVKTLRPDVQVVVVKAAAAYASTNNQPITAPLIQRTAEVIEEAMNTGHVDTGSGESNPVITAITVGEIEAIKRQKQYIAESMSEMWATYRLPASLIDRLPIPFAGDVEVQVIVRVRLLK